MNSKFEPTKYSPDMTYGDWDKLFLNDLVILGKSAVWMESGIPGAAPSRLPNATTKARLAQVCKSNTERCALIGVTDRPPTGVLELNQGWVGTHHTLDHRPNCPSTDGKKQR